MFRIGVYSDDWERYTAFSSYSSKTVVNKSVSFSRDFPLLFYRFPQILPYTLTALVNDLTGDTAVGFVVINFVLNFFIVLMLYKIFDVWVSDRYTSLLSAFFVGTVFNRDSTFYWGSTQTILLSMIFFLLVLYMNIKDSKLYVLFFVLSLLSLWSYEIGIFIPVLILIYDFSMKKKLDRRSIMKILATSSAVFSVFIFKFFVFPRFIGPSVKASSVSDAIVFGSIWSVVSNMGIYLLSFNPISNYIKYRTHFDLWYTILSLLFLMLIRFFYTKGSDTNKEINRDKKVGMLLCGFLIFSFSILTMLVLGIDLSMIGKGNRVLIFPLFGYGFIVLYLIFHIRSTVLTHAVLVVLISLNIGLLSNSRSLYIKSWSMQRSILENIKKNTSFSKFKYGKYAIYMYNTKKTLDFGTPFIDEYWTSTYFIRFATGNKDVEAYVVSGPRDIQAKSAWNRENIPESSMFLYDVKNDTVHKYHYAN